MGVISKVALQNEKGLKELDINCVFHHADKQQSGAQVAIITIQDHVYGIW